MNTTALAPGETPRFGIEIAPRLNAPFHQHIFAARLDMSVDGDDELGLRSQHGLAAARPREPARQCLPRRSDAAGDGASGPAIGERRHGPLLADREPRKKEPPGPARSAIGWFPAKTARPSSNPTPR